MRFWTLGAGNALPYGSSGGDPSNGGIYGPYDLGSKVIGLYYAGETGGGTTVPDPNDKVNVNPSVPQLINNAVSPTYFADGVSLGGTKITDKRWVRFNDASQTWYFTTPDTGAGGNIFVFGLIEDECFEAY